MNLLKKPLLDKAALGVLALFPVALLISMAAMETLSWLLFLLTICKWAQKPSWAALKLGCEPFLWGFIGAAVLGVCIYSDSSAQAMDIVGSLRWALLLYSFRFWLVSALENSKWEGYLEGLFLLVFAIGVYAFLQFEFGWEFTRSRRTVSPYGDYFRAVGFYNMALTFSSILGMWGMVALGQALKNYKRWPALLGLAGALSAVVFSLSRGAYVALAVSLIPVLYVVRKRLAVISLVVLSVVAVSAFSLNPVLKARFTSMVDGQDESNSVRMILWRTNFEILKDHPWLGVGLSRNKLYLQEYYDKLGLGKVNFFSHAHNNFVQIFAGTGLIGGLLWLALCFWFLREAWRSWRHWGLQNRFGALACGLFAAQLYFHAAGMTETSFTDGEVNHNLIFIWATVASLYSLRLRSVA